MIKIHVILGTIRRNRFSEKPGLWIFEELQKREGVEGELIDLRDYELPFFNEEMSPSSMERAGKEYANETVKRWTDKVAEADGYIIVTGEYNHGYPAVLKNALDWVFREWRQKPVGFISYGSVGGARVIEQLRQVAVELELVPIREAIHIPSPVYLAVIKPDEAEDPNPFEALKEKKEKFLDQLCTYTRICKNLREKS